ncbi:MAG: cytochrome P460 family protein [Bacteroidetes bacterium]|nr:cytochrome P460 family protein [Bacteroidota bacterium]
MLKKGIFTFSVMVYALAVILNGCKKSDPIAENSTDQMLYDLAKTSNGFKWYKNSDKQLAKSSGSAHSYSFLRTRYNAIAAENLDSQGKIIEGKTFKEGSLIVKELSNNASALERYAILYKNSSSPDGDAKGWVWGYINANQTVADAASNKGRSCTGCHSQAGNVDYMLMNKFFP